MQKLSKNKSAADKRNQQYDDYDDEDSEDSTENLFLSKKNAHEKLLNGDDNKNEQDKGNKKKEESKQKFKDTTYVHNPIMSAFQVSCTHQDKEWE